MERHWGSAPNPAQGRCPRDPHQGHGPWTAIHWVRGMRGADTDVATSSQVPLIPLTKMNGSKGHYPWWGPGAKPLVGSGAKPQGFP